jgi:hypothetical protein
MLLAELLELLDHLPWSDTVQSSQQISTELELLDLLQIPNEAMEVDDAASGHEQPGQGMFHFIA